MTIRLALFGDSIAAGVGATSRTDALAARLSEELVREGHEVAARVFAVSGARSADLGGQVDTALTWRPHVAVVVIGANDLIHRTRATRAAHDLAEAVRRLRDAGAEVVVAPAPDLSALPYVPGSMVPLVRSASMLLRDSQIVAAKGAGAHVADCDHRTSTVFAADPSMFSSDQFHPSSAGYAVIAEALFPAVADAANRWMERRAATPAAACTGARIAARLRETTSVS